VLLPDAVSLVQRGGEVSVQQPLPPAISAITEDLVARLCQIAGLNVPAERLPAITERLRELHILASALDSIDHDDTPPANAFDPSWTEGAVS
jgi:hypothetical protein